MGSSGSASGNMMCGPMMCPWPTGWRQLESLGEAQQGRDKIGVIRVGLVWRQGLELAPPATHSPKWVPGPCCFI